MQENTGSYFVPVFKGKRMKYIWIIGAGKFGKKAAIAVSKKMKNSEITFVDKNIDTLQNIPDISYNPVKMDGVDFLVKNLKGIDYPDWILPVIPVHLAYEWIKSKLSEKYRVEPMEIPPEVKRSVPGMINGKNKEIYMSYATFICPDNCPEPLEICSYTGKPRLGILHKALEQIQYKNYRSIIIKSRQLSPGIGGYTPADLYSAMNDITESKTPVLFSTACRCHGVMNAFTIH